MDKNLKDNNLTEMTELTLEQLLDAYINMGITMEQLEAQMSVIKEEMVNRLDAAGEKAKIVGEYAINKVIRTNFKPTLEQARELAATKTVEQVDTEALKRLYDQGIEIPNTTTTTYLTVKPLEKKGKE